MCNLLHNNSKPIPEKGIGWKVFQILPKGKLGSWNWPDREYTLSRRYTKWEAKNLNTRGIFYLDMSSDKSGFCFYINRKEAIKTRDEYNKKYKARNSHIRYTVKKIKYRRGLGKHIEEGHGEIGIVKEYKLFDL